MREYGKLYTKFWSDPDIGALNDQCKLLAAYLLTGPHTTMIGCFRLPVGYVCADLNWARDAVRAALTDLTAAGFITYDHETEWVHVTNFFRYNALENPNQTKAAGKLLKDVPRGAKVWATLVTAVSKCEGKFVKPLLDGLGTVSQRVAETAGATVDQTVEATVEPTVTETVNEQFRNQEQEQEQEQKQEQEQTAAAAADVFLTLPTKDGKPYPITHGTIAESRKLYPCIDVEQEVRNMRGYLVGNPDSRKPRTQVMRFFYRWLQKAQDQAPKPPAPVKAVKPGAPVELPHIPVPSIALPDALDEKAGRKAWAAVLEQVKGGVQKQSFETWLKPLSGKGVKTDTRTLYVQAPSVEFMHVTEKYGDALTCAVTKLGLDSFQLFYEA